MAHTFIVSDESVNSYGMIVRTDGIDVIQFSRNPIMLYMHDRTQGVVGRWENIRKDGNKLLADAVFDDSSDLGRIVRQQVEKGFLRSASIGIEIISTENIDGQSVVTKSILTEISIVDIPSNNNALKLHRRVTIGARQFLSLSMGKNDDDFRSRIIQLLQMREDSTDEAIFAVITALKSSDKDQDGQEVEKAIQAGIIRENDRNMFLTLAATAPDQFRAYFNRENERRKSTIQMLTENAFRERKIMPEHRELFRRIGEKIGLSEYGQFISSLVAWPKLSKIVGTECRTLEDYRKHDPEALQRNPALYRRLLEDEEKRNKMKS